MARHIFTISTAAKLIFTGSLLAAAVNYQTLLDQYALTTYQPVAEIAGIVPRLGLTDYARGLLYRANPVVAGKAAFNNDCETVKGELELGCYYRSRIYVLRIDNLSLAPEMDVVTAHELLHAAWGRLSAGEKARVTADLQAAYAGIADPELKSRMAQYAKSEPGQENNELHSILATEFTSLPPSLETYYARYFTSRNTIVKAHQTYQNVFDSRRRELEAQLAAIRSLKSQLTGVNRQLDAYRVSGSIAAYNNLVPRQNRLVDSINQKIDSYQTGVDEYNALSRILDSQQITDTEAGVQK